MRVDPDDVTAFAVWPKAGCDVEARTVRVPTPKQAAELCAKQDWIGGYVDWPITYCVRDLETGTIWAIDVALASQPTFVAYEAREVSMPASTHVLWGGAVLCADLRLRGVPRDWPKDQRWISLADVATGTAAPDDACWACWGKAPELIAQALQIGKSR